MKTSLRRAYATGSADTWWPSAGRVLAVGTAVPPLLLAGWLAAGLPLLLLGWYRPLPALLLGVPLAALACRYGLRRLPATVTATAWQTTAILGIVLASAVFNGLLHSEQLIVRRDPATYAQYAIWLAGHGSLPIPYQEAAFGGADRVLQFDSVGFYDAGGAVVPQFMAGPPLLFAVGHWLGGIPGLLLVPPVLGALAVLTFAGVAARLVGGRGAVLAALTLAVTMPLLYTARTTFSEPLSLILLFGGVTLLLDARARLRAAWLGVGFLPERRPAPTLSAARPGGGEKLGDLRSAQWHDARLTAVLAGLVFGLAVLVRIDGLRDVLPVLAYAGLLLALRPRAPEDPAVGTRMPDRRLGAPLLGGLLLGAGLGLLAGHVLARPYLDYLADSLRPLLAICAAVLVFTAVGVPVARRVAFRRPRLPAWPPTLLGGLVVFIMLGFAVRPWLETVRRQPVTDEDYSTAGFIELVQRSTGLPVDGTRLYYENSLYWVIWYVGVPVVVLATLAAALLVRRLARGSGFDWLLPLAVIGWTTVTTLARPAITPDHPWAARRLVPIVVPGLILLAVWGLRWVRDKARRKGYGPRVQGGLAAAGALLVLVPGTVTSIGTAFTPIERGEAAAVAGLCAAIPSDASVLMVERVTADRYTQLVRGTCGVPTAQVRRRPVDSATPSPDDVRRLIAAISATGRRPVLLAAEERQLAPYGTPRQVLRLRTLQDERSLVGPPDGVWSFASDVWLVAP